MNFSKEERKIMMQTMNGRKMYYPGSITNDKEWKEGYIEGWEHAVNATPGPFIPLYAINPEGQQRFNGFKFGNDRGMVLRRSVGNNGNYINYNNMYRYCEADVKATKEFYEYNSKTITKILYNPPATVVFFGNKTKVVAKAIAGDIYDPEKGVAICILKKFAKDEFGHHWYDILKIVSDHPAADGTDLEKAIAVTMANKILSKCNSSFAKVMKQFPCINNRLKNKDVLVIKNGVGIKLIKNVVKPESELTTAEKAIKLFNEGCSISKIAKMCHISEYYVRKYIDAATSPESKVKPEKILKKAEKSAKAPKKPRGGYHPRRTSIDFPDYLDEETCNKVLEYTKEKYKDDNRLKSMSNLQRYFIAECKREYIKTHYGNGYDSYAIGKILGISAAAVMRLWYSVQNEKG